MKILSKKQLVECVTVAVIAGLISLALHHPIARGWDLSHEVLYVIGFQFGWALLDFLGNVYVAVRARMSDEAHECSGRDCAVCENEEN